MAIKLGANYQPAGGGGGGSVTMVDGIPAALVNNSNPDNPIVTLQGLSGFDPTKYNFVAYSPTTGWQCTPYVNITQNF
jgi:hypothetical protein